MADLKDEVNTKVSEVVGAADAIGDSVLSKAETSKYSLGIVIAYSLVMFVAGIIIGAIAHKLF